MNSRSVTQCIALGAGGGLLAVSLKPQWTLLMPWDSTAVAIAIAAAICALFAHQPRWLQGGASAGIALLIGQQFVLTSVNLGLFGVALLLGCLAGLARSPELQCALGAGVMLGMALDGARLGMPRRYADYEPSHSFWSGSTEVAGLVLAGITLIALLWAKWSGGKQASAQVLAVCVALPLVVLFETQLMHSTIFAVVAAATLIAAAFLLPGSSGLVVLAGGTIAIAPFRSAYPSPVLALALCVAIIAGLVLGRRWPHVPTGIVVVALAVSPALLSMNGLATVALLIGALGAAYAFASAVDVPAAVLAVGIAVPFFPTVVERVNFGWTAYTPLTDLPTHFTILTNGWLPALILAAYAGAAFVLTRLR
ncbi:hypothetical protein [Smaragdicoccus niigatensis]|uniref:hypothetical protein n=1 Tax=Smaragdicoccus niigatensis TaxID=359359 RepID=UPI000766FD23|nr:hypothetical protein [Smaragdicoccus niigatensis]